MPWSRPVADGHSGALIDSAWLHAHPLPAHGEDTDKNSRGHVIAIGGSRRVPGGLLLTGEAALRAGAGKTQLATIESCASRIGLMLPEAGVIELGETPEGEVDAGRLTALGDQLARSDSVVIGPAMTSAQDAGALLEALFGGILGRQAVLVDAVALHAAREHGALLSHYRGALIITPNPDELASCLDCDQARIASDPAGCACEAARRLNAVTVCKGSETFIAAPDGALLSYPGGGVGLATGGSGDVLVGIIAALAARGSDALTAAAWGVWLHGEAGRRLAERIGAVGFLARELLPLVPGLMREAAVQGRS